MKKFRHITAITALGLTASLALAGCATGNDTAGGDSEAGDGDKGTITLGFLPSWTDGLSMAYLLQDQFEKLGYTVEMQTLTEAGPLYTGLAQGDVDMYPSAWPEVTHVQYMEEYGDDLEDLGAYYENAKLTIAVPSYMDIDSIEDLKGSADRFDGKIIGIEPGAGLTRQTQESMLPEYDLEGEYTLETSSTAAMLTVLGEAIDKEEDVVVTLWRPFWANSTYDVKDLEDPKGAMGDAETLNFIGHKGFAEQFPEAAELVKQIKLDDDQYGSLEDLVVNEFGEGQESEAIDKWLEDNADQFDWVVTD
ncbi:glycine betaine/proline transport system substrate-binding protein [Microbacterium ginsengiterrae]|uniref:Glycine betaine/proline transport system substrate-binding protein n=1 Tax=Microbacterium ginsengiterrae TaxID=546115 RepID=A0A7W9CC21_9MICO|nr:glycine betaine ABC transporter substrate-binding protein [Microbacterium ginsengiterrae]MBB5742830.1 glycine betaine/proline transport system substrate-binding protein [Microbacterium ginsengiterrae]